MSKDKPAFWIPLVVRHPWWVITTVIVLTVALGFGIPRLSFDTDLSDDIPDTIPEKAFFDEVGRIFPSDDVLFIALRHPAGIWTVDYLSVLKAWSDAFETFNGVKGVLSLASAGLIRGTEAGLEIETALPTAPRSPEEVEAFRQRLEGQTITEALLGKDGQSSALLVTVREGLDFEPVPRVVVRLPSGEAAPTAERLRDLEATLREPLIGAVDLDPSVWDSPRPFTFTIRRAEGHTQAAFEAGLRRWIQQRGRVTWGLRVEEGLATVRIEPSPNETWAKTRDKVEDFIRFAPQVLALPQQPARGRAVIEVLRPDVERERLSAAVNYGVDPAQGEGLTLVLVPEPAAEPASLLEAVRQALPEAQVEYLDRPIPFYFRAQAALELLPKLEGSTVYISGSRAVSTLVQGLLVRDLSVLFPVVVGLIVIILYLSFRTLRGVLLPLANVIIAVVWLLGLQGWLAVPLSTATAVLPIILIAVGTAYTIHVINRSYLDFSKIQDKKQALESSLQHVSIAVILAGMTTMIGFGSLSITNIIPLMFFGILSALGILFGLVLALTFSPAVLSVLRVPKTKTLSAHKTSVYAQVMESVGLFTARHPKAIFALYAVLAILAAVGATRVRFETNNILNFRPETDIRVATEYLNEQFTGITQLAVVVRVEEEGGVLEPAVLKAMDGLLEYLKSLRALDERVLSPGEEGWDRGSPVVGGGQSIATFVKAINKAVNEDRPEFDRIPEELNPVQVRTEAYLLRRDGALVELDSETGEELRVITPSEYRLEGDEYVFMGPQGDERRVNLVLGQVVDLIPGRAYVGQLVFQFESAGDPQDIEAFIDSPRRTARMNIFLKTASSTLIRGVQAKAQQFIQANFPAGVRADLTGQSQLTLTILNFLVMTQLTSVLSSLVVIFVMIALLARSVVEGFFSILPLAVSILLNFGIMGWFRIPIDISTATIASIAIGIGIDYTLHFLERFKFLAKRDTLGCALVNTMKTTGVGILFNALAVAGGFSSLMLSQITGNFYIGLLMALVMITASVGAVTLLPAALLTFKPAFLTRGRVVESELDDGFTLELDRCLDE